MPDPVERVSEASTKTSLASAADKIRESAKWLLASFAAVGVILAGGLQLADLGGLSGDDPVRLTAAIIGLAVTIVAIVWAVNWAGKVASSSHVNLQLLSDDDGFALTRLQVNRDDILLAGFDDVAEISQEAASTAGDAQATYSAWVGAKGTVNEDAARLQYEQTLANAKRVARIRDNVVEVASFLQVRNTYERARTRIGVSAAVAAMGIALFAWGANAPDAPPVEPGAVLPRTPSEVTVQFREPTAELISAIGEGCDATDVAAIAMTVHGQTYEVATLDTSTCDTALLTVRPRDGAVIPRVEASPDAGEPESPDVGSGNTG